MPTPPPDDPPEQQIEDDIRMVVGGNFTVDALGATKHQAIIARVKSKSGQYLDRFESLFLRPDFDLNLHSQLYPHVFLRLLAETNSKRVRNAAARLLDQYKHAPSIAETASGQKMTAEDRARFSQRMEHRGKSLEDLALPKKDPRR